MKKAVIFVILILISFNLLASFDCLTAEERAEILRALDMAFEYRQILDGSERVVIEEVVKVDGDIYRVRVLAKVWRDETEKEFREIRRDIYIEVKAKSPTLWPWIFAGFGAGILAGFLISK